MRRASRRLRRFLLLASLRGWHLLVASGALTTLLGFLRPLWSRLPWVAWLLADLQYLLGALAIVASVALLSGISYAVHDFAMRILGSMLKMSLSMFSEEERHTWHLKSNIMLPFDGTLREILRYGHRADERSMAWEQGRGVCGVAFVRGEQIVADLLPYRGRPYEEILHEDGQPLWGMSFDQWEHTSQLGSVASFPLKVAADAGRVVGVLNVDSTAPLSAWYGPREARFLGVVTTLTVLLAVILDSGAVRREAVEDGPETAA